MTTDREVLIEVQGLQKSFGELHVLKGIDAEIRRGDVMVVVGASGSGKSTFLRCLNLLEHPTGGTITFEGVNITDPSVNINLHRQKMGMVFQQFNLFPHKTVLKNMTLGPTKLLHQSKAQAEKHAIELLGTRRSCRQGECVSQPALRRSEAACGNCACAGDESGRYAL